MEIVIRNGDHEVTVRDQRPVLEADVLTELLTAVSEHIDTTQGTAVTLPFGFTGFTQGDDEDQEDDEPDGG